MSVAPKLVLVSPEVIQNYVFPFEIIEGVKVERLFEESFEHTLNFPHLVFDKKVAEHMHYKDRSLWYATRFIFFNRYKTAYKEFRVLENVLRKYSEKESVTVFASSSYPSRLDTFKGIKFVLPKAKSSKPKRANFIALFVLRSIVGWFTISRLKTAQNAFILPPIQPKTVIDIKTLKKRLGITHIQYFLDSMATKKNTVLLHEISLAKTWSHKLNRRSILNNSLGKVVNVEPFIFQALMSRSNFRNYRHYKRREEELFAILKKNAKDDQLRLMNLVNRDLLGLRATTIFRIEAHLRIINYGNLKTLGCIDENGLRLKSIIDHINKTSVWTYSIQHGAIYPRHLAYHFLQEDFQFTSLTDTTFVFGNYTKRALQANNYPPEKINVSGQIRTDVIPQLKGFQESQKAGERPIVLYASQPLFAGEEQLRDRLNKDFFKLSKRFPEYQFVLKPHPSENDPEYFHALAEEIGSDNYSISNGDLYSLLNECAVLLTYYSTVGAEAVAFDKAVITLDYTKLDLAGYHKNGVALRAENYDTLEKLVQGVLEGDISIDQDSSSKYKLEYFGNIDGKVSERITQAVLNAGNNSR